MPSCDYCGKSFYGGDGLTDNGDYMCGECMDGFSQQFEPIANQPDGEKKLEGDKE